MISPTSHPRLANAQGAISNATERTSARGDMTPSSGYSPMATARAEQTPHITNYRCTTAATSTAQNMSLHRFIDYEDGSATSNTHGAREKSLHRLAAVRQQRQPCNESPHIMKRPPHSGDNELSARHFAPSNGHYSGCREHGTGHSTAPHQISPH